MTVATSIQGPSDLLDVRRKILQQTNPLKAKILIFSTLYHRFSFSELDWQILRDQDLDNLLRHLYSTYQTPLELEERLFDTARNSEDPDDEAEVARIICKFLKPCYPEDAAVDRPISAPPQNKPSAAPPKAPVSHRAALKNINPEDEATLVLDYARDEISMAENDEEDDDDRSGIFDPDDRPEISVILEQTTVPELRKPQGDDRRLPSEDLEVTEDIETTIDMEAEKSETNDVDMPSEATPKVKKAAEPPPQPKPTSSPSTPTVGSTFSIADSLMQNLNWEEEVKHLVSDGAKTVLGTIENTVKNLEMALEEKLNHFDESERFSRKHRAMAEWMVLLQGNLDRMNAVLERMAPQPAPEPEPEKPPTEPPKPEVKTSTNSKLEKAKQLARKGHSKAIATLLARDLKGRGIHPIVTLKGKCLHLILESEKPLSQQKIVAFARGWVGDLTPEGIVTVKVYGRAIGQKAPDWSEGFDL